jgi:hypothetical protein
LTRNGGLEVRLGWPDDAASAALPADIASATVTAVPAESMVIRRRQFMHPPHPRCLRAVQRIFRRMIGSVNICD